MTAVACFSFDNLGEAAEIRSGKLGGVMRHPPHASIARGLPALLALLARQRVRATFFVEGWNGVHHPDAVAEIVRSGHEIGMHGWLHETWYDLAPDTERALAIRATDALEGATGTRPRGFRAPGGARSRATASILAELDYHYDASLGNGMRPGRLASGLAQVPFVWPGVDGFHYLRPRPASPDAVRDGWLETLARTAERGGLFLLICHAFVTGVDAARLDALEAVMEAAQQEARIAVRTTGEVACGLPQQDEPLTDGAPTQKESP